MVDDEEWDRRFWYDSPRDRGLLDRPAGEPTPQEKVRLRNAWYDAAHRIWSGEPAPPEPAPPEPEDASTTKPLDPAEAARRAWYDRGEIPPPGVLDQPPRAAPAKPHSGALEEVSGFLTVGFLGLVFLAVVGVVLLVVAAVVLWAYRTVF